MMTDNSVVPFAQPDVVAMAAQLEHQFDGFLDGAHNGMIELAWTNAEDGKLRHAEMFHTDDLDKIAQRAFEINSIPGQNVYVGAALRKPGTFPGGRAEDEDYYATTAFYVDLDDEGAADAVTGKYRGCKPTLAVVTGRQPYKRVQLWWRLETPERDPELHRAQCLALAIELGGDRTVVNPSRVMRLGGSIAWPRKQGRVIEKTEVITFADGRPLVMMPGQLAKAFPPLAAVPLLSAPQAAAAPQQAAPAPSAAQPQQAERSPLTGRLRPSVLMDAIRSGNQWHNNMIKLVAHWVGRGLSDAEIINQAAGLTLPGYTVADTVQEMMTAVRGARAKWAKPSIEAEFDPETGEVVGDMPGELRRLEMLTLDEIDRLQPPTYVIDGVLTETGFTLVYGATASFKSFLALDWLLSMAYGEPWCGRETLPKTVLYIAGEGVGGIKKRIQAWRQEHSKAFTPAPFYMLRHGINFTKPDDIQALLALVREFKATTGAGVEFAAVDTVARAMVGAEEKDATAMGLFIDACDTVRREFGCGLVAVHHTGKDATLGARGSSALPAAVDTEIKVERSVGTDRMTMEITKQKDDEELAPMRFVATRVELPGAGLKAVTSLVLKPDTETETQETSLSKAQVDQILKEVARAWNDGNPWSHNVRSKTEGRWLPRWISVNFGIAAEAAQGYVEDLMFNQFMAVEMVSKKTKKVGLKALKYHSGNGGDGVEPLDNPLKSFKAETGGDVGDA